MTGTVSPVHMHTAIRASAAATCGEVTDGAHAGATTVSASTETSVRHDDPPSAETCTTCTPAGVEPVTYPYGPTVRPVTGCPDRSSTVKAAPDVGRRTWPPVSGTSTT